MSMGSDLFSSITGNTDKACLVVHDVREQAAALENQLSATFGGHIGTQIGAATKTQSVLQDKLKKTMKMLQNDPEQAANVSALSGHDKTFFVQFNPSTLQLNSFGHPDTHMDVTGSNADQNAVNDTVIAPRVNLTVQLIFDQMNIYDAFMFDKVTSGVSATTVTNAITAIKGTTFTVQPYVEGLISALRNPYTQSMTFQWADFSFTGRLRQLHASYTMFSTSGRPIRATVQLHIQQDRKTAEQQKWKTQLDTLLSQKSAFAAAGQKVSNLFNLSF